MGTREWSLTHGDDIPPPYITREFRWEDQRLYELASWV